MHAWCTQALWAQPTGTVNRCVVACIPPFRQAPWGRFQGGRRLSGQRTRPPLLPGTASVSQDLGGTLPSLSPKLTVTPWSKAGAGPEPWPLPGGAHRAPSWSISGFWGWGRGRHPEQEEEGILREPGRLQASGWSWAWGSKEGPGARAEPCGPTPAARTVPACGLPQLLPMLLGQSGLCHV